MTEDEWDVTLEQNLKPTFVCGKTVARVMIKQQKGSIVNVASIGGFGPLPNNAQYGAAKAGIVSLTQSMAWEWAPHHIRVNAVAPGVTSTPATDILLKNDPNAFQEHFKSIPLGRIGKPEDIAGAAIYLASDAADYVTGQIIMVTGGALGGGLRPSKGYRT
jgi:NAD(P)-dependent dehydrogenase (short-subunit alcohol dehydrogenase family)